MPESYTVAIILAIICLAGLFLFLAKVFSKEQKGIKTLLVMFSLGACILIAQTVKIIAEDNGGSSSTNLAAMGELALIVSIVLFIFFIMYYFITYTRDLFKTLARIKEEKRYGKGWM